MSYHPSDPTPRAPRPDEDVSVPEAMGRGVADHRHMRMRTVELRDAVASWRAAERDHGHTSYYGARHIRAMRAYWIGRLRASRAVSFEVLDAARGPLYGAHRVTLAGPYATREAAEVEADQWRGATDPRVVAVEG